MNLSRALGRQIQILLAALALVGASAALPQTALAYTCSTSSSSHCYALAIWVNSAANEGIYTNIYSSCLNGPNDTVNFADEEMWEATDNSSNLGYWVETGLSYGELNGQARGGPYWFWADNRPGGGYHEHYVGTRSLNTSYETEIIYAGSNSWWVWQGTSHVGTSTSNPPYSLSMETGIETTSNSYNIVGQSSPLDWFDTTGSLHTNWQYGSSDSYLYPMYPPANAVWISKYNAVVYSSACNTGASQGSVPIASAAPILPTQGRTMATAGITKTTASVPASAISSLTAVAGSMAAAASDSSATTANAVVSTRQDANTVASGAGVNSNQGVYLVQIQGKFTGINARMPAGKASPTGTFLTVVIDAGTGFVLDWGLSDSSIDLSTLGPVTALPLQ